MLPGLPPPAPVSSHTLMGVMEVGKHHAAGTQRMQVTSGGVSVKEIGSESRESETLKEEEIRI